MVYQDQTDTKTDWWMKFGRHQSSELSTSKSPNELNRDYCRIPSGEQKPNMKHGSELMLWIRSRVPICLGAGTSLAWPDRAERKKLGYIHIQALAKSDSRFWIHWQLWLLARLIEYASLTTGMIQFVIGLWMNQDMAVWSQNPVELKGYFTTIL